MDKTKSIHKLASGHTAHLHAPRYAFHFDGHHHRLGMPEQLFDVFQEWFIATLTSCKVYPYTEADNFDAIFFFSTILRIVFKLFFLYDFDLLFRTG